MCCHVLSCFKPITTELVGRACSALIGDSDKIIPGSYAISKLVLKSPFLADVTGELFTQLKATSQHKYITENENATLIKVFENLVLVDARKFFVCINWTLVLRALDNGNLNALRCLSTFAESADLSRILPRDVLIQNDFIDKCLLEDRLLSNVNDNSFVQQQVECETVIFDANDVRTNLVPMSGILLPVAKMSSKDCDNQHAFAVTKSLSNAVKALTCSLATQTPIIIEGELGTGKTSLLEYFAKLMGRSDSSEILKLQLGEQTDSKVLLFYGYCYCQKFFSYLSRFVTTHFLL